MGALTPGYAISPRILGDSRVGTGQGQEPPDTSYGLRDEMGRPGAVSGSCQAEEASWEVMLGPWIACES